MDYLIAALRSCLDNSRTGADSAMTAAIFGLSEADTPRSRITPPRAAAADRHLECHDSI
jgi:hypothetical protein